MSTIPDLRKRAWSIANSSINLLNNLNDIIFEDSSKKPAKIEFKPEDTSVISLQYIQDGIDIYNVNKNEISQKTSYLQSLIDKNQECKSALTQLVG